MSNKRPSSPNLIPNPFIKKRNLDWALESPKQNKDNSQPPQSAATTATTAAIESGDALIADHLTHFTTHLSKYTSSLHQTPGLPISDYTSLYESSAGSTGGAHFVIHQHDHPIAGTHYDLRLQINETSSVSWAIMYGLPGDPNSVRLNRNATETRIHCLWNHLVETASSATGSLIIWDTGTYSILPRKSKYAPAADPSSQPSSPSPPSSPQTILHAAFQTRKIRLCLHGTRLPDPYVLSLRLTKPEDASGRARAARTPRTSRRRKPAQAPPETSSDEDRGPDEANGHDDEDVAAPSIDADPSVPAMERELRELEDAHVRRTNAYPGADNSISSVHGRKWYLSLDREACGFTRHRTRWEVGQGCTPEPGQDRLSFPFYVRGAAHERSVVTGRRGEDVLRDEGVTDFVPRKGWTPVLK